MCNNKDKKIFFDNKDVHNHKGKLSEEKSVNKNGNIMGCIFCSAKEDTPINVAYKLVNKDTKGQ